MIWFLQQINGKEKKREGGHILKEIRFYMWILFGNLTQINQLVREEMLETRKLDNDWIFDNIIINIQL